MASVPLHEGRARTPALTCGPWMPRRLLSRGLLRLQVVTQRLMKLETAGSPVQLPAEVIIRRRKRVRTAGGGSTESWEMVRARGHLDEVEELRAAATTTSAPIARAPCMPHQAARCNGSRCLGQLWAQAAASSMLNASGIYLSGCGGGADMNHPLEGVDLDSCLYGR